jgi:hypothetical protein
MKNRRKAAMMWERSAHLRKKELRPGVATTTVIPGWRQED